MLNFNQAIEHFALTSSRVAADVDAIANTLATVYADDIPLIPWGDQTQRRLSRCLNAAERRRLVLFVLRDLQDGGAKILEDRGLRAEDEAFDSRMTFSEKHRSIIQDEWDALGSSPVWSAFERQISKVLRTPFAPAQV
jgi:hypothetical protein